GLLQRDAELKHALEADAALSALAQVKRKAAAKALDTCGDYMACFHTAFRFTDEEINSVAEELGRLPVRRKIEAALRDSGAYVRWQNDADFLPHAWREAAQGINRLIAVYGEGAKPRYAEIDSPAFEVWSSPYRLMVHTVTGLLREKESELPLFFQPS